MPFEAFRKNTNALVEISKAHGNVELDRGGYWSKDNNIWVDKKFPDLLKSPMLASESGYIEVLGAIGLSVGSLFNLQLNAANEGVMWPPEIFGPDGDDKLLAASEKNPSILNPYSLNSGGFKNPSVPYSIAYADELKSLNRQLAKALELEDSPSAKAHQQYLKALLTSYSADPERTDDLEYMKAADRAWVGIPPNSPILIIAEPTEVYHDPAQAALGQNPKIAQLNIRETEKNGLGIWKPFFEFRLLVKDNFQVGVEEINEIRQISRAIFGSSNAPVPVSLEFRRLLLASGNGAHPAKTAKNYPNFEQIRDKDGYKNVIYTNMIEEGTLTQILPALKFAFGAKFLDQFGEQELLRGNALYVVSHEENHPFKRFRDTPLEELKSSLNGEVALIKSDLFSDQDVNSALFSLIGHALYGRGAMVKARKNSDTDTQTGLEGYYKGDTALMNYLVKNNVFIFARGKQIVGVDFELLKRNIINFAADLELIRSNIPEFYKNYGNESVWDMFKIIDTSKS